MTTGLKKRVAELETQQSTGAVRCVFLSEGEEAPEEAAGETLIVVRWIEGEGASDDGA
ncbi:MULTISPECIES: hypothetical protein [unclassified Sphingomonas]|uniref:hypothetical protein n=1 Tax=unclassified Sphingomonas TaxID=196159 RepID=UPI0035A964BE